MGQTEAGRQLLGCPVAVHLGELRQALEPDVRVTIVKHQTGQFEPAIET